jgi:hypothetical protein
MGFTEVNTKEGDTKGVDPKRSEYHQNGYLQERRPQYLIPQEGLPIKWIPTVGDENRTGYHSMYCS